MENGRYLLDLSMQSGARPVYSEEELAVVTGKLWGLLSRLAESYTGSASSSLRAETAQALLQSACFLLSLSLKDGADPTALVGRLCDEDYDKLFQRGLGEATARLEAGKELLSKARETMLRVNNTAYSGTLRELGGFFDRYNYYYFAHEIPCLLDYPLAVPVDEKLLGIVYIHEYLRRLVLENEFCSRFDAGAVGRLVGRVCPDDGLVSLYEAVMLQAVALTLIDGDVSSLDVTAEARRKLQSTLREKSASEHWLLAAGRLCVQLELVGEARAYLLEASEAAFIHVRYAAELDRLDAVLPQLRDARERERMPAGRTRYIDGEAMSDEKLRALIDELASCRYVPDKVAMVRQNVKSMRDLFEVLNICFWGDEGGARVRTLDGAERALLSERIRARKKGNPDWRSESGWEERFSEFIRQQTR
jgi:hypothetical protein